MAKVTAKLQVTLPKVIADQYDIEPGDEIEFQPAGELIRVIPPGRKLPMLDLQRRLEIFDLATARQRAREQHVSPAEPKAARGWTREEAYRRGRVD